MKMDVSGLILRNCQKCRNYNEDNFWSGHEPGKRCAKSMTVRFVYEYTIVVKFLSIPATICSYHWEKKYEYCSHVQYRSKVLRIVKRRRLALRISLGSLICYEKPLSVSKKDEAPFHGNVWGTHRSRVLGASRFRSGLDAAAERKIASTAEYRAPFGCSWKTAALIELSGTYERTKVTRSDRNIPVVLFKYFGEQVWVSKIWVCNKIIPGSNAQWRQSYWATSSFHSTCPGGQLLSLLALLFLNTQCIYTYADIG
jgi:hypothetical protein